MERSPNYSQLSLPLVFLAVLFLSSHVVIGQSKVIVRESPPPTLEMDAAGELVEYLQRTLNARLSPSPSLDIDGDFGRNTRRAVELFQISRDLEPTGRVDAATWMALGKLIIKDEPIDDVQRFNRQRLPREPNDALIGLPFLTCKAWVITDASTGEVLWGENYNKAIDIASTTKIMTAYLVLKYAETHPQVLQEVITFSKRADGTPGSTAGVRADEKISVGELLYGLMLPSGNDASVAFAEFFGGRLSGQEGSSADESYDLFIGLMNAMAKQLGMNDSHYVNPHGLTAKGHLLSASDLAKLADAAFDIPLFRQYVNTRQHATGVTTVDGPPRRLTWKNTNRLLGITGYDGVKTGTTTAAGACLVSHGVRDGNELFIVVLGASGSSARYADSRNLYRWAWNQLAQAKKNRRGR
ncbi:MAG: D-alanyl-D-alanine carboxypeptidase [Planctomycetaceae bacterium]|nr:D-alanyl-D-alanine carboxypeptidase [Planctomycetaceae bacterium]MBT4845823.1 D-alanyl-D-alanine carboxypeptidase [Planctomycetaceae bacterium]MBT5883291.1 D-alanyl-D-alanine carboxypeptidase [Planctomycetaceae bacterium]